MARPRHQRGWLEQSNGKWVAHWYTYVRLDDGQEKRREREKALELKTKMRQWEALKEVQKLIDAEPALKQARPDPRTSLDWFYTHRFKPLATARWRGSTNASQPYAIEKNLLPRFGAKALGDITRFEVQTWLDGLKFSRAYVRKLRTLLHHIFEEAIDQEYLDRNPVTRTRVHQEKGPSSRFLSLAEIATLENLEGRERLVFHMLTLLGLRPGELFARRWADWQDAPTAVGAKLHIADDVWRGTLDDTKTPGSKAFVCLPKLLRDELAAYRATVEWTEPQDFIFCHRRGIPLDAHNYLRRVFKPRCEALKVSGVTFQCFRRTCSTYLVKYGGNIKDAQAHLRHANATTTLGIYTKEIPESVRAAVEELSRVLFPKASSFSQGNLFKKATVN